MPDETASGIATLSPIELLEHCSKVWPARDLILRFDADFDVPFRHGACIGLLEMQEAFAAVSAPASRTEALLRRATRVGAFWCRIVRADVTYRLYDGIEAIDASRLDAEALRVALDGREVGTLGIDDRRFVAYAAARWWDGAGKIHFRCGDYSNARLNFERALWIAQAHGLWHCEPDLRSNFVRGQFQERSQVGKDTSLRALYQQEVHSAEARARRHGIDTGRRTEVASPATVETREFLRGLCSLYHNLATELLAKHPRRSVTPSRRAEAIARRLGDGYRLGQALNNQAFAALREDNELGDRAARALFERVLELPGERARQIALQNLTRIEERQERLREAMGELETLLETLRHAREQHGGDAGLDVEFHYRTVARLAEVVANPKARLLLGEAQHQSAVARLEIERMDALRSVRRVVTVSQYKQAFARRFHPDYLRRIGAAVDQMVAAQRAPGDPKTGFKPIEEVCALVEEASARELLDLLASRNVPAADDADFPPLDLTGHAVAQASTDGARRRGRRRRRALGAAALDDDKVRAGLEARLAAYERISLRNPIPMAPPDAEIGYQLRMFTANHPDMVIVRYFHHGASDQGPAGLGALVFRRAHAEYFPLDLEATRKLVAAWDQVVAAEGAATDRALRQFDLNELFRVLVKPWWRNYTTRLKRRASVLVLIPSGDLFKLPLHLASIDSGDRRPIAATLPVCHSVSATAFVGRGRHLLRRQRIELSDELCAVVFKDEQARAGELKSLRWPEDRFLIAGDPPAGVSPHRFLGKADWQALRHVSEQVPEIFLYSGHGLYFPSFNELGAALVLDGDLMTQFDVATRLRLRHNKLTILGACLSGQGAGLAGEVAGFLRAFMAAGAGALGVTLWSVLDNAMSATVRHLLQVARRRSERGEMLDLPREICDYYRSVCERTPDAVARMEGCALALYC